MAAKEQLQIIRQGADVWNEWRKKNPELVPDLRRAKLPEANLGGANLSVATLIYTDLRGASLAGSNVYGASVWDIKVDDQTEQQNLVITPGKEKAAITVDNIKVAQFIYLLLNNQEIRDVIDTVGRKLVLILGCFTPRRKRVLDALRDELRRRDYLPVVFDFEKPASRDLTETISTLAHMARFAIADLSEAEPNRILLGDYEEHGRAGADQSERREARRRRVPIARIRASCAGPN